MPLDDCFCTGFSQSESDIETDILRISSDIPGISNYTVIKNV